VLSCVQEGDGVTKRGISWGYYPGIELDGDQHGFPLEKNQDLERESWLRKEGFKVLRFWNNEVLQNLEGVLDTIIENCQRNA